MNKRIIPSGDPRWARLRARAQICWYFRVPVRMIGPEVYADYLWPPETSPLAGMALFQQFVPEEPPLQP